MTPKPSKRNVKNNSVDTIVAIASPPGKGGVGIVRISGPQALSIAKSFTDKELTPRYATFAPFYSKGQLIDEGLVLFFPGPNSFTGEDVIELQAHGGPLVMDQLVQACLYQGARLAKPGEFSERAFLNNKIDLAQAEAIADLINATSEQAARSAVRSLQGEFSNQVNTIVEALIRLRMMIEAAIDFPEEEIDFLSDTQITGQLDDLIKTVEELQANAQQGALLQEGMTVVIAGKPNAGKSTLLNALAGKESAIVTEIAGTTRDVVREYINIDGLPLHIVDTAGLRVSDDPVEQEGMRRAREAIEHADLVLHIVDATSDKPIVELHKTAPVVIIKNKIDLNKEKPTLTKENNQTVIYLSAKYQQGIDILKAHLKDWVGYNSDQEGIFIARRRHVDAIKRAYQHLLTGDKQLKQNKAGELLAEELRQAQQALNEITGEFTSDDLLGKIFSSFCIGK